MRVLLIGHGCSPKAGSEPGITWSWAWHLSQHHEVWLLCHPERRTDVEEFLSEHPNPNLHIRWVELPSWRDPWTPEKGLRGIGLHYVMWLSAAYQVAVGLTRQMKFDIVHQVGWITINAPSPFWKLGLPFVWGPVGGGQVTPPQFRYLFAPSIFQERVRDFRVKLLPFYPPLRTAARRSSMLFATNQETAEVLAKAGRSDAKMLLDCGLRPEISVGPYTSVPADGIFTLLWASRIQARKALPLAIESLALLPRDKQIRLIVAGDGEGRASCEILANKLGIADRIAFLGFVPWTEMPGIFERAQAFLFTSVRDTFGSVLLEAAAHGLPIIALDHQGVAAHIPADCSIKVPVTTPSQTISALANAILTLEKTPALAAKMSVQAQSFAAKNTWDERARAMTKVYTGLLGHV